MNLKEIADKHLKNRSAVWIAETGQVFIHETLAERFARIEGVKVQKYTSSDRINSVDDLAKGGEDTPPAKKPAKRRGRPKKTK